MASPNIIVITASGLRPDALGCAGNPDVQTPNIDALTACGTRFASAISPRPLEPMGDYAFLTGHVPTEFAPDQPNGVVPPAIPVLPRILREAGYRTGVIGMADGGAQWLEDVFDTVRVSGCAGLEDAYRGWLAVEASDFAEEAASGEAAVPLPEHLHPVAWTGEQAVRYCQTAREPFFSWFSFPPLAPGVTPPMPWKQMYRPARLALDPIFWAPGTFPDGAPPREQRLALLAAGQELASYYGSISYLDRQIGRILATLTARGRTNNIIVLTAGEGAWPVGDAGECRGLDSLPEARVRVPLLVGGLPSQRKGGVEPSLVALGDVAATLLDVLQLPSVPLPGGRSFQAQLIDSGVLHRAAVVLHGSEGAMGLRTARYKWIVCEGLERLHDLQADPLEMHNLHETRQSLAVRKVLRGLLQRDAQLRQS
jgi:arylsulfatase